MSDSEIVESIEDLVALHEAVPEELLDDQETDSDTSTDDSDGSGGGETDDGSDEYDPDAEEGDVPELDEGDGTDSDGGDVELEETEEGDETDGLQVEEETEEEAEEETEEEVATSAISDDSLHKIDVNGEEQEVTLSELKSRAQKVTAAEQNFREASGMRKEALAFYNTLTDLDGVVAGLPKPIYAIVKAISNQHTGGDLAAALDVLNQQILPAYVENQSKFAGNPELRGIQLKRHELEEKERRLKAREQATEQKAQEAAFYRRVEVVEPQFVACLESYGLEKGGPEADRAWKKVVGKIIERGNISSKDIKAFVEESAGELSQALQRKLRGMTAEELKKLNPQLGGKLLKSVTASIKKDRPTKKGKASTSSTRKARTTKPRRRTSSEPVTYDSIDELVQGSRHKG